MKPNGVRVAIGVAAASLLMLANATPGSAKTILKIEHMKANYAAEKASDGTLTLTANVTTANPRCLSSARFKETRSWAGGNLEFDPTWEAGNVGVIPYVSRGVFRIVVPGSTRFTVRSTIGAEPYLHTFTAAETSVVTLSTGFDTWKTEYRSHGNKVKLICVRPSPSQRKFFF